MRRAARMSAYNQVDLRGGEWPWPEFTPDITRRTPTVCRPDFNCHLTLDTMPVVDYSLQLGRNVNESIATRMQAVEDRRGEDVVAEDRAPLRHDLVGGDQQAAAFVPAGDELEKEMRAASFKGQVAELDPDRSARCGRRR